jgi:hypothetical protein
MPKNRLLPNQELLNNQVTEYGLLRAPMDPEHQKLTLHQLMRRIVE